MVTYRQLKDAEPAVFGHQAQKWRTLATQLGTRGGELDRELAALADWRGRDADGAKHAITDHRKALADMRGQISKVAPVLEDAETRFSQAQTAITTTADRAHTLHLKIDDDGRVQMDIAAIAAMTSGRASGPVSMTEQGKQDQAALQREVDDIVRAASEADANLTAQLSRVTAASSGFGGEAVTSAAAANVPPRGSKPADVRKWWDSLSVADRESLMFTRGREIGSLDGIPVDVRDRANRAELAEDKGKLTEEQHRLNTVPHRDDDQQHRLDEVNANLGGIDKINQRLTTKPSDAQQQAYLIDFDANGKGRAVVAAGNPDTSANVLTYVPGTGARMSKAGGDLDRSDKMAQSAKNAGSPSTSAITWIGYDAPQNIVPEAADEKYAQGARGDLDRFQDGLRASHDGPPSHNTVIGHSYGSTVVGHTARDNGLNADDVIFVGSPGVGVDHASDLHLDGVSKDDTGAHVHSSVAEHDIIKGSNLALGPGDVLGPDPADSDFAGSTFSSDPGKAGPWYENHLSSEAHSQYWDDGSKSLVNIGNVVAGKPTF